MNVESSGRDLEWTIVVGRSFGIPDTVGHLDARRIIIECIEGQLRENGWQGASRAIAEPMLDALIELGANGGFDACLLPTEAGASADMANTRDAAHRIIDRAIAVVDPEHLVIDVPGEYPSEILLTARHSVEQVVIYLREQSSGA
jgi:hypothetical protein